MSSHALSALTVLCMCAACGGGEKQTQGVSASARPPATAAGTTSSAPVGAPKPITGKTWDVKMIGDASGYRFDPASLTIKAGDGVRWTVVSGIPHNVTFWPDSIPQGAAGVLQVNMPQQMTTLSGPLLANLSATYTVSFAGAPAGTYHYYCTPHLPLGMKGTLVVQ